jgi:transcription antitermination factor NusG
METALNESWRSAADSPMIWEKGAATQTRARWYVAHVRSRHEKHVARQLEERQIDHFLPLYCSIRRWKDRRKELEMVLFPGYIFVHLDLREWMPVLRIPGFVRLVGCNTQPVALPNGEIEALRHGFRQGINVQPHPFLKIGRRVRVRYGPLAGTEGILLRRKDRIRVVISIDLIMRSVAVELDEADISPL